MNKQAFFPVLGMGILAYTGAAFAQAPVYWKTTTASRSSTLPTR